MNKELILTEPEYKAVRSSGAGGQNVNKVFSKAVLSFDVQSSNALNEDEKILIEQKLSKRINSEGKLILQCDEDRSQLRNKDIVTKRFLHLIEKPLHIEKPRVPTKIPKAVIKKRIENKRQQSEKKQSRRKPDF